MTLKETLRMIHDLFQDEEFRRMIYAFSQTIHGLLQNERIVRSCQTKGWLPYYKVPFEQILVRSGNDDSILEAEIDRYYKSHSKDILDSISAAVDSYRVDEEAKETLVEALKAHEYGLYRCPPRLLLPEIERVVNKYLLKASNEVPVNKGRIEAGLQDKYLEDVVDEAFDLDIFGVFINHLFERFDSQDAAAATNIPNRAGVTHGWQTYSSAQASMNAIVCTDYLYRILP